MGTLSTSSSRCTTGARRGEHTDAPRDVADAFEALSPVVLQMARNAGFPEDDQRELVQQVGLVLAERLDDLDPRKGTLQQWGTGVARHLLLDMKRAARKELRRREAHVSVRNVASPALTPEQALRAQQALRVVHASVREEDRAVFELDALGCSAAEIGERLGIPRATVEWRLKEARKRLSLALARLREERAEVTRVRGILWPFAITFGFERREKRAAVDRFDGSTDRSPNSSTDRSRRGAQVGLWLLLPALLSLHFVAAPPSSVRCTVGSPSPCGRSSPVGEPGSMGALASATVVAAPRLDGAPHGNEPPRKGPPKDIATPRLDGAPHENEPPRKGPPKDVATPRLDGAPHENEPHRELPPADIARRTFGDRRWLEYRTIVGASRDAKRSTFGSMRTEER